MRVTPVRRALLSAHDKTDLAEFVSRLAASGASLVASGGTAAVLARHGLAVVTVEQLTGGPEMLGGRIKTLHSAIAAAILADRNDPAHLAQLESLGIIPIDLVVVDLYPFGSTLHGQDATELIDVGGVTLLRAAAKNHAWVGAISSREQYEDVAVAVEAGGLSDRLRLELAREAIFRTAAFDAQVLAWLERPDKTPERAVLPLRRTSRLRYGENPHQEASLYQFEGSNPWWVRARLLQGKELSYNNVLDAAAAWRQVSAHDLPTAAVIKHTNPCGVASREEIAAAFHAAWECDPQGAYGGVVGMNRPLDAATAGELSGRFVEVIVAPQVDPEAGPILARRTHLRVLEAPVPEQETLEYRGLPGGLLVQEPDVIEQTGWKVVSRREPTPNEAADLRFGWVVAAAAASNAVVISRALAAVGIGAGDQSRIGATERALRQAGDRAKGATAASDGFVPFRDTIDAVAEAGVTALVEPGGSVRDEEVIAAADANDMALLFTGTRHFRH